MSYYYQTRVPNELFDKLLTRLTGAELKVLLVVIRQTLGWIDKRTGKPKEWDWISISFFAKKTGLSNKAIGSAIANLIVKQLILVKDQLGRIAHTTQIRKHAKKLFYKTTLYPQF